MFTRLKIQIKNLRDFGMVMRLMRELAADQTPNDIATELASIFADPTLKRRTKADSLDEFVTFMSQRSGTASVLARYGYTGQDAKLKLKDLYNHFVINGAGAGNTHVPNGTKVIFDLSSLTLVLQAEADNKDIVQTAIDYFKSKQS